MTLKDKTKVWTLTEVESAAKASVEQMKERMETFYRIIRSKHPDTPVIFIEDPIFTHTLYDERIAKEVQRSIGFECS